MFAPPVRRVSTYQDAEEWVKRLLASKMIASNKVVGFGLRARLNFTTGQLNPSIHRLALDTRQSDRVVDRGIRAMQKAGFLEWIGRGRTSNNYVLIIPPTTPPVAQLEPLTTPPMARLERATTPPMAQLDLPTTPLVEANNATGGDEQRQERRANLVLNHESNLPAEFGELLRQIGKDPWHQHLWRDATIEPPRTILFRSPQCLAFALKHYQADFERLGYQAMSRRAA
jgi:hypothetical protein